MNYVQLGAQIRKIRKSRNMTQAALSKKANISLSTLGHIERGARIASLETLFSIAAALGVPIGHLIDQSRPENPSAQAALQSLETIRRELARIEDVLASD